MSRGGPCSRVSFKAYLLWANSLKVRYSRKADIASNPATSTANFPVNSLNIPCYWVLRSLLFQAIVLRQTHYSSS